MKVLLAVLALIVLFLTASSGAATDVGTFDRDRVFSPDGKTLAFVRFGATNALMLIGADGKHLRTLVSNVDASGLAWAPDGSSLVYSAVPPAPFYSVVQSGDIWRANVATGAAVQLTNDGQYNSDSQPSWSPDGATIAYDRFENSRCFRCIGIWIMNADGSNQHEISQDDGRHPTFSPTSANELAISDSSQGRVIDLSGATIVPNSGPLASDFTTWSPRGTYLAYLGLGGLWVENLATMRPRRVSKLIDGNFSWSPDGCAFAAGYNLKVALLRAKDGSHFKILQNSKIYGGTPSWAKGTVAYVHTGYCGIDLANEDGTHIRRLTRTC